MWDHSLARLDFHIVGVGYFTHSNCLPIMPQNQVPRNIFVYDANVAQGTPPILVAGFWQFGPTTAEEFYFNLEFCFQQPPPANFRLLHATGTVLSRDGTIVATGNYFVISLRASQSMHLLIDSGSFANGVRRFDERGGP